MNEKEFIGLTLQEAKNKYDFIRVMAEDGDHYIGTCDYREERMNVELVKGLIIKVWMG